MTISPETANSIAEKLLTHYYDSGDQSVLTAIGHIIHIVNNDEIIAEYNILTEKGEQYGITTEAE